jgi:hypothetical protein
MNGWMDGFLDLVGTAGLSCDCHPIVALPPLMRGCGRGLMVAQNIKVLKRTPTKAPVPSSPVPFILLPARSFAFFGEPT